MVSSSTAPIASWIRQKNSLVMLLFFLGTAGLQLTQGATRCSTCFAINPATNKIEQESSPKVEMAKAREQANSTRKRYEIVKRLAEKGSANKHDLRLADLRRKIALLNYSSLLDPARADKNRVLKAEVVLRYRSQEFDVAKKLYMRRSISRVDYERAASARAVAASNMKAIKSTTETQEKVQLIQAAKARFEIAQKEFEIAKRLFETSSISQQDYDRVSSKLKIATAELEASKESLGARATVVTQ